MTSWVPTYLKYQGFEFQALGHGHFAGHSAHCYLASWNDGVGTPWKINMEPEKKSLEWEIPFGNHHFQVPC